MRILKIIRCSVEPEVSTNLKQFSRNKLSMKLNASTYVILSIWLFSGFAGSTKKKKESKHEDKKALKRNIDNSSKEKFPNEGKFMLMKEIFDRFTLPRC